LEGTRFPAAITHTFVNGHLVYKATDKNVWNPEWNESKQGERLKFER
jgi:dihydroorotase